MISAMVFLPVKDGMAKILGGAYPPLQIIWAQFCIVYLVLAPVIAFRHGARMLWPRPLGLQVLRGVFTVWGIGFFYWAVRYIPLASTTSIYFLAPLVVTALSPLVLKERVDMRRWIAVVVGFLGVTLILRPDLHEFNKGFLIAFIGGISIGLFYICNRKLANRTAGCCDARPFGPHRRRADIRCRSLCVGLAPGGGCSADSGVCPVRPGRTGASYGLLQACAGLDRRPVPIQRHHLRNPVRVCRARRIPRLADDSWGSPSSSAAAFTSPSARGRSRKKSAGRFPRHLRLSEPVSGLSRPFPLTCKPDLHMLRRTNENLYRRRSDLVTHG